MKSLMKKIGCYFISALLMTSIVLGTVTVADIETKAESIHITKRDCYIRAGIQLKAFKDGKQKGEPLCDFIFSFIDDEDKTAEIHIVQERYVYSRQSFVDCVNGYGEFLWQLNETLQSAEISNYLKDLKTNTDALEQGKSETKVMEFVREGFDLADVGDIDENLEELYSAYYDDKQLLIQLISKLLSDNTVYYVDEGENVFLSILDDDYEDYGLENPRVTKKTNEETGVEEVESVWDCVWFGRYPQSDPEGIKKEPIKWRVLSVNGSRAFLLADANLDCQPFHSDETTYTWEDSYIRAWLNNDFLQTAFKESEQKAISTARIENGINPFYERTDEVYSDDDVFLLSIDDVLNEDYGFDSRKATVPNGYDAAYATYWYRAMTRNALNTAYACEHTYGEWIPDTPGKPGPWWLRSPGYRKGSAVYVYLEGNMDCRGTSSQATEKSMVRPCLYLNLKSEVWSYAGLVGSDGTVAEFSPGTRTLGPADISEADVSGLAASKYTGNEIRPIPIVKYKGRTLTEGKDYTVSYQNNVNAGTANVIITGIGNFEGTKTVHYNIYALTGTP